MSHRLFAFARTPLAAMVLLGSTALASPAFADQTSSTFISIGDGIAIEGDSGQTSMSVPIGLSNTTSTTVTAHLVAQAAAVSNAATPGSACGGGVDFIASDQLITIPANTLQTTAYVTVCGDTALEGTELFSLLLTQVQGAGCYADGCGAYGVIRDNESFPKMSVSDASGREGDVPMFNSTFASILAFYVTLSAPTTDTVTVNFHTVGRTATEGTSCRLSGVDFVATSGTLTFSPGETQKLVKVGVCGDILPEPNENFTLQLSVAQFATLVDSVAVGTIINDD